MVVLIGFRLVSEVDWIHFHRFFSYLGPVGVGVLILFLVTVWGTAQVRKERLGTIKSLIQLSLLILFFSYAGSTFQVHLSDLAFSIIMLATFASTFIFNGLYVRWRLRSRVQHGEVAGGKEAVSRAQRQ
jgi:hypothetical protein